MSQVVLVNLGSVAYRNSWYILRYKFVNTLLLDDLVVFMVTIIHFADPRIYYKEYSLI